MVWTRSLRACAPTRAFAGHEGVSITTEIVAVGNELLSGDVMDTNSHWLCQRLTGMGAHVHRVTQVLDDAAEISASIQESQSRGADLVIVTGGLGPTADDRTLEGVARATGTNLRENPEALEWVTLKYRDLALLGHVRSADMTAPRRKMALLPEGAEPLANDVGAAPGVLLQLVGCALVCLPGVPAELRDIFDGSLQPALAALFGASDYEQWHVTVGCGDESVLAPILSSVGRLHPKVHVKSRARSFGCDNRFRVTLSARAQGPEQTEALLTFAWNDLQSRLAEESIEVSAPNAGPTILSCRYEETPSEVGWKSERLNA